MSQVVDLAEKLLVGHARGHKFCWETIDESQDQKLSTRVSEAPDSLLLAKDWFQLIFKSHKVVELVVKEVWSIHSTPIIFKFWSPPFDASKEGLDVVLMWVHFPGLPTHMWNLQISLTWGIV